MTPSEMTCDPHTLRQIYRCTAGYCHRCRRKLAFTGFARRSVRGAWDIDANLRPACRPCLARRPAARVRPPAPPAPRDRRPSGDAPRAHERRAVVSCRHTILGGLLGAFFAGPWGALLGGLLGSLADAGGSPPARQLSDATDLD
jgi:hypothetical protein